jgi:queuine tRNA-ribosyltransferase
VVFELSYIPLLNTPSGACLSAHNWQELGITTAAVDFERLLVKPGIEALRQVKDLKTYLGWVADPPKSAGQGEGRQWVGKLVLDARHLVPNAEGILALTSSFDGSKLRLSVQELVVLIKGLKPDAVLFSDALRELVHLPELHAPQLAACICDQPAKDALGAFIYQKSGPFLLSLHQYREDFRPLDSQCQCPTCLQKCTRAYLHHLFVHTPLLCQRFLIQHNAYFSFTL